MKNERNCDVSVILSAPISGFATPIGVYRSMTEVVEYNKEIDKVQCAISKEYMLV